MRHMTAAAAILAAMTGPAFAQSNEPCEVHVGFSPRHAVVTEGGAATLNLKADFRGDIPDGYELLVEYETDSTIRWQGQSHDGLGPDSGVSLSTRWFEASDFQSDIASARTDRVMSLSFRKRAARPGQRPVSGRTGTCGMTAPRIASITTGSTPSGRRGAATGS